MSRSLRRCAVITGLLIVALSGCRGARFKEAQAQRDATIRKTLDWYHEYNARGPENIRNVGDLMERHAQAHEEKLRKTRQWFKTSEARRREKWEADAPRRRAFWRDYFDGDPENIAPTYARMMY